MQKLREKAVQEAQPKLAEINKQLAEMGYFHIFFFNVKTSLARKCRGDCAKCIFCQVKGDILSIGPSL